MTGARIPSIFTWKTFQDLCVSGDLFSFSADDASRNRKLYPDILGSRRKHCLRTTRLILAFPTISPSMNQRALRDKSWGIYCDCKRNKGRWWTVRAVLPHPGAVVSVHGFHFPRRSMARCPRAGKFPAERKNRFLHGRRRLPARETLGGRFVSAGDGISGQLHIFRYPEGSYPCRNV